jgi:NitT/TauT family transport system permease protein
MVASKDGLGNLLVQSTSLYDTAKAFAIITIVTVVSVLIITGIDLLENTSVALIFSESSQFSVMSA